MEWLLCRAVLHLGRFLLPIPQVPERGSNPLTRGQTGNPDIPVVHLRDFYGAYANWRAHDSTSIMIPISPHRVASTYRNGGHDPVDYSSVGACVRRDASLLPGCP